MDSLSAIGVASQLPIAIEIQVLTPTCGERVTAIRASHWAGD